MTSRSNDRNSTSTSTFFSFIGKTGEPFFLDEKSNSLGNVQVVVSDRKVGVDSTGDGKVDWYRADVVQAQDYYPFGSPMQGRTFNAPGYRFGYNGQEKTDEISGSGNHYTAEFWEYDPRSVHRWQPDPVVKHHVSPYAILGGNPIWFLDPNGDDWFRSESGSAMWRDSQDETWDYDYTNDDGVGQTQTFYNIGQYHAKKVGDAVFFYDQQELTILEGDDVPQTFQGFGADRYQMWDPYISGFSDMHGADPNYVKSIMIQESACCQREWRNDPMTMFNPGDYEGKDDMQGFGTLQEITDRFNEDNQGTQFANGIYSINYGTQWLYGQKRRESNTLNLFPPRSATIPVASSTQAELWRMAFRYNGSPTVLRDSGYQRRFVYSQRVYERYLNGTILNVPTGTAGYNDNLGY